MTFTVFQSWGVNRCEDFGEIVFNLVETGMFSKTEEDSRPTLPDVTILMRHSNNRSFQNER